MPDGNDKAERINWKGADLRGVNMAGVSLEGADLRASDLRGTNFTGSNLRYADLRGSSVQGANFQNANLYGAKMQGVEAAQADFRGADLRLANFGGAYLEGAMMPPPQVQSERHSSLTPPPKAERQPEQQNAGTAHGRQHGGGRGQPSPSGNTRDNNDGQVLASEKPNGMGWAEWIEQKRKDNHGDNATNDQNEGEQGRVLPDEQRKKAKERERGRDR